MLFEYPVYQVDIKARGFRVVSLGSQTQGYDDLKLAQVTPHIIEVAADQAINLLTDAKLRQETVTHNFELGRKHYSMEALRGYLASLISS